MRRWPARRSPSSRCRPELEFKSRTTRCSRFQPRSVRFMRRIAVPRRWPGARRRSCFSGDARESMESRSLSVDTVGDVAALVCHR